MSNHLTERWGATGLAGGPSVACPVCQREALDGLVRDGSGLTACLGCAILRTLEAGTQRPATLEVRGRVAALA